jgi:hypothetical protein
VNAILAYSFTYDKSSEHFSASAEVSRMVLPTC